MQTIKDKFNDMTEMRKAKAEAREEEKAEKELAKTRVDVAHEVRLAREAEAQMDLHVNKAAERVAQHEEKQRSNQQQPDADSSGGNLGYPAADDNDPFGLGQTNLATTTNVGANGARSGSAQTPNLL